VLPIVGYGVHRFGCGVGKANPGVTRGKPYKQLLVGAVNNRSQRLGLVRNYEVRKHAGK